MRLIRFLTIVSAGLIAAGSVLAQAPYVAKGNQEGNVFGGLSYGLDHWRGSYGANYAFAPFDKYMMIYGEYSYFPGIDRSIGAILSPQGGVLAPSANRTFQFNDLNAGVHIRLPIFPEKRIVPYLSGGVGYLHANVKGSAIQNQGATNSTVGFSFSSNGFAMNGGGGLRLYLSGSGRFGLRLEGKVYKPTGWSFNSAGALGPVSTAPYGKITLGIFYQFK